jgi:hypothetical protein
VEPIKLTPLPHLEPGVDHLAAEGTDLLLPVHVPAVKPKMMSRRLPAHPQVLDYAGDVWIWDVVMQRSLCVGTGRDRLYLYATTRTAVVRLLATRGATARTAGALLRTDTRQACMQQNVWAGMIVCQVEEQSSASTVLPLLSFRGPHLIHTKHLHTDERFYVCLKGTGA